MYKYTTSIAIALSYSILLLAKYAAASKLEGKIAADDDVYFILKIFII